MSVNFDPRSEAHNTEFGLFIRSPELARQMLSLADILRQQGVWQVHLGPKGTPIWFGGDADGLPNVLAQEPESTWWDRFLLDVLTPFTPEDLL